MVEVEVLFQTDEQLFSDPTKYKHKPRSTILSKSHEADLLLKMEKLSQIKITLKWCNRPQPSIHQLVAHEMETYHKVII